MIHPEIPVGLSLDRDDESFVLRRKEANGDTTAINMSEEEFWGLKETIDLWTDRLMSARQVESGSAQVTHPVAQARLSPDAMQENVLLTVAAPTGEQMTLQFPQHVARYIAGEIPDLLRMMAAAKNPIKQ
jgi:hypothetical protein